jgi:hypothetical protein
MTDFIYDDGGRAAAGFRGRTGDCTTRAIAIATGRSYREVYDALNATAKHWATRTRGGKKQHGCARTGVSKQVIHDYMADIGWEWVPTMKIGQGCKVHLRTEELPAGRIVVFVSGHTVAVVDGAVHDTYDPTRDGTRCVYGYFKEKTK